MIGNRYSAMEHLVPEQMFSTEEVPAEGISAVKAIAIAGTQGQKIWTITQDNLDTALSAINLDRDTENEIRNSVNAGRVVTIHEQSINFNGWVGEGYIILDPETGAGAYKIAGGGNGAFVALGYIIGVLSFFMSLLDSYASSFGSVIPAFATIGRFLTVATFVHSILKTGGSCSGGGLGGLIFAMTLFSIMGMLMVNLISTITNPLLAFASGLAIDQALGWLLGQSKNCK
ncbi:MAG: hypothetical protein ACI8SR_000449 [Oceanicoccus sp.]|jgi:hypothetical protein